MGGEMSINQKDRYLKAKNVAKREEIEWTISEEEYSDLLLNWECYYCSSMNTPKSGIGLDIVDETLGYTLNNVVPCCQRCRRIKGNDLTQNEVKSIMFYLTHKDALQEIIGTLHLCAYRYVDGRSSYITSDFNNITKRLLLFGFSVDHTKLVEGRIFARDRMGWRFSGLTQKEHETGLTE